MVLIVSIIVIFLIALVFAYKVSGTVSSYLRNIFSIDKRQNDPILTMDERAKAQKIFFRTVFSLLGYIAKSDGRVNEGEIKLTKIYMEKMDLSSDQKNQAVDFFKEGADSEFQLKKILHSFKPLAEKNSTMTEILLVYLINLARADGLLVKSELDILHEVAEELKFTNIAFNHLLRMISSQNTFSNYRQNAEAEATQDQKSKGYQNDYLTVAYDALGISAQASNAEIKDAYRNLINQYHPDKLVGQGLPDFMIKAAAEHVKRIQVAYDYIKKFRNGL